MVSNIQMKVFLRVGITDGGKALGMEWKGNDG